MEHEVGVVVSIEWRNLISSCTKWDSHQPWSTASHLVSVSHMLSVSVHSTSRISQCTLTHHSCHLSLWSSTVAHPGCPFLSSLVVHPSPSIVTHPVHPSRTP